MRATKTASAIRPRYRSATATGNPAGGMTAMQVTKRTSSATALRRINRAAVKRNEQLARL